MNSPDVVLRELGQLYEFGREIAKFRFRDDRQDTAYLLSDPANAEHVRQSIREARTGQVAERELVEP